MDGWLLEKSPQITKYSAKQLQVKSGGKWKGERMGEEKGYEREGWRYRCEVRTRERRRTRQSKR